MAGYVQTVAPTIEPFTLEEATAWLRLADATQADVVNELIKSARSYVEEYTGRQLITATWRYDADCFPWSNYIELDYPKLLTVSSFTYYDSDNVQQTLSAVTDYEVDTSSVKGVVRLRTGKSWQSTYDRMNAVSITFTAGYGATSASIPRGIMQAMRVLMAHWYENREATITGTIQEAVEFSLRALLWQYVVDPVRGSCAIGKAATYR